MHCFECGIYNSVQRPEFFKNYQKLSIALYYSDKRLLSHFRSKYVSGFLCCFPDHLFVRLPWQPTGTVPPFNSACGGREVFLVNRQIEFALQAWFKLCHMHVIFISHQDVIGFVAYSSSFE